MIIIPRFIRAKDAPGYLGMDRNKFAKDVKPYLTVIQLSTQAVAYDRLDLDAFADDIKSRNGRPPEKQKEDTLWVRKDRQDSTNVETPGISTNKSKATADFAKALDAITSQTPARH